MSKNAWWKFFLAVPVALCATLGGTNVIPEFGFVAASPEAITIGPGTKIAQRAPFGGPSAVSPERLYLKVWEIIRTDYYEPDFHGQNWNRWKDRYAGKLKTQDDAHKAIETMLASLGDRYTRFLDKDAFDDEKAQINAQLFGVGIQIGMDKSQRVIVIAPIDGTPASRAGLLPGDEIAEIDGKPTKGLSVEDAAKQIKGPKGSPVELTLVRGGANAPDKTEKTSEKSTDKTDKTAKAPEKPAERIKVKLVRDEIHISAIQTAKVVDGDIGYIRLTSFISSQANEEMKKALTDLSGTKGIILDLRDNPGGLLTNAIEISNMFLAPQRDIVFTVDRDGYKTSAKSDGHPLSEQPMVVLINKGSASASEIASGALKDNGRATLVGQRSFGKGLVQGITKLEDGSGVNVTIAKYLTPSDTDINKKGITPDVVVELTEQDYEAGKGPWWNDPGGPKEKRTPEDGKDVQLKRAIEVLRKQAPRVVSNNGSLVKN
jgi:carboxyl-terminal processing protease